MKRILNIIGIFFLSIIVFTSCQKSPEELNGVSANEGRGCNWNLLLV